MLRPNPKAQTNCSATAYKKASQDFSFPLVTLMGAGNVEYMAAVTLQYIAPAENYPEFWKIRVLNSNKDGWEFECKDRDEAHERWYELLELPVISIAELRRNKLKPI